MKGVNSVLIVILVMAVSLLSVGYYIAYTGRKAADMELDRCQCFRNQCLITYLLHKYRHKNNRYPTSLYELKKSGIMTEVPQCPSSQKDYYYESTCKGKEFILRCPSEKGEELRHNPHLVENNPYITDKTCKALGYNLIFNAIHNDNNVRYIAIWPKSFGIKVKKQDQKDRIEYEKMAIKLKNGLRGIGIEREVKFTEF